MWKLCKQMVPWYGSTSQNGGPFQIFTSVTDNPSHAEISDVNYWRDHPRFYLRYRKIQCFLEWKPFKFQRWPESLLSLLCSLTLFHSSLRLCRARISMHTRLHNPISSDIIMSADSAWTIQVIPCNVDFASFLLALYLRTTSWCLNC